MKKCIYLYFIVLFISVFSILFYSESSEYICLNDDVYLDYLYIDNISLNPTFESDIFEYSVKTNEEVIKVKAGSYNNEYTISGFGKYNLDYGLNVIKVKVSYDGIEKTYTLNVTRIDNRSDNTYLSNISVSSGSINFNKDTHDYYITLEDNISEFSLMASASDGNSTVSYSPSNKITVFSGETKTITINVTSQKGSTSIYSVHVTRESNESNNSYLKNITISNASIDFNKYKFDYNVYVSNDISNITINAYGEDSHCKLSGGGNKKLSVGLNEFTIKVEAENGSIRYYKINVYREDYVSIDDSLYLRSLSINEIPFEFNKYKNIYFLYTSVSNIDINVESESNKVNIDYKDNYVINDGINEIIISISNGEKSNVYKLYVIKDNVIEVNNNIEFLNVINKSNNYLINNGFVINDSVISYIKDNNINTKIYYNSDIFYVYNLSYNNISGQVKYNYDDYINIYTEGDIDLFVGDKYNSGDILYLYGYDSDFEYIGSVSVINGFISIKKDKYNNYALMDELYVSESKDNSLYAYLIIGLLVIVICFVSFVIIKKVRIRKKINFSKME